MRRFKPPPNSDPGENSGQSNGRSRDGVAWVVWKGRARWHVRVWRGFDGLLGAERGYRCKTDALAAAKRGVETLRADHSADVNKKAEVK